MLLSTTRMHHSCAARRNAAAAPPLQRPAHRATRRRVACFAHSTREPHLQLGTAKLPRCSPPSGRARGGSRPAPPPSPPPSPARSLHNCSGIDMSVFQSTMFQWATTLTLSGGNLPFAAPLRVDKLPSGFQVSQPRRGRRRRRGGRGQGQAQPMWPRAQAAQKAQLKGAWACAGGAGGAAEEHG
jgi:hypothetical protein